MEEKYKKIIKFNKVMGFFHLIQAFVMILLSTSVIQKIAEFKPTIVQYYLTYNFSTQELESTSRTLFDLPFGFLVSLFLFVSAGAHFIILINSKKYVEGLKNGINKFRWFEYALSSSIMIVLIATLFGIYDIASLLLIFVVNALMNLFGLVMEQMNSGMDKKNIKWEPFVWGSIAGITSWVVIFIYMFGTGSFDMVPWFVWAITGTYFLTFNTFPINMILQYKKIGKWRDYLYGEKVYIILSLVAKSLLAWLVLFGAMQP